jgi:hypothetical protein
MKSLKSLWVQGDSRKKITKMYNKIVGQQN